MNRGPEAHVGRARRQHRSRPTPRWLTQSRLEATARSRLLLVLSVLSGEKSVTEAIAQAKISRGLYYQLETRALWAMLLALNPRAASVSSSAAQLSAATARIAQLQAQVERLQQEKRRTQRLLLLTRKSIRAPVKIPHRGRWPLCPPKIARRGNRSPLLITRAPRSDAPSSTRPGAPSL
jgi:hypothetical protein